MKQIFDIFSKKSSKKIKKKPKIILDYREKNSLIPFELTSLGVEIEFKNLKIADYITKGVVIERKTVSDFISSMINKRLLKQLKELKQYPNKLLIVEGINEKELYNDSENWTGMHPNSVRGFLLSIVLKYQIPIIFTKDYIDTAKFLYVLAKRKPRELPLNVNKKSLNKRERLQFILEGFPGIGPKTARKLLKKFKTLKNLTNTTEEELKEIIGKKAEILSKIINEKY